MRDFDKVLDNLRTIKLTGGIFGKTSLVLIFLILSATFVSSKVEVWWVPLVLMLPAMGIVVYILKRCLDFEELNPQAAIMDGAELLVHERITHERKGQDFLPDQPLVMDHPPPQISFQETGGPDIVPLGAPPTLPAKKAQ